MTQQVLYDILSSQVLQWQDTEQFSYGPVPSHGQTLLVTSAEWANQAGTWYVVNGVLTQTDPNVPTSAQLLAQAQQTQIIQLNQACRANIVAGFQTTSISPSGYVTLSTTDQANNQLGLSVAARLLTSTSVWASGEVVAANSVVQSAGGDYYVTFSGGTTGAAPPTWPTTFSTPVTDNTVIWELWGWPVGTDHGMTFVTPLQAMVLGGQGAAFIANCRIQYQSLKTRVLAATSISAVQSIVWTMISA